MRLPKMPRYAAKQRYLSRFWSTDDMFELLSIYYGATPESYPRTWQYRAIIAAHRAQHSSKTYTRSYGPDWKCLKKEITKEGAWTGRWVPDKGVSIKGEVIEYGREGRLPIAALEFASTQIREAELKAWVHKRAQELSEPLLQAAE